MNAGIRAARLVLCICGAAAYGGAWWTLFTRLHAARSFWAGAVYVSAGLFSTQALLGTALFVGLATGIGAALSQGPSSAGRGLLRFGLPVAVVGLLAGGVSVLVMSNIWSAAIMFGALAVSVAVFAIAAGAWAGAHTMLRASLAGPFLGLLGGLAFGLGLAQTFAAIYTNPCFPGHRYCLDPGRWYFLPIGLEAGLAAGLWLGLAASAALAAASALRWTLPAPATR